MIRVVLGSAAAAVAMLVVGFLLYATPLNRIGTGSVANAEAAQLQAALAANLRATGTYTVPDPDTAEQTVMYGQGPIATVHYNASGYAAGDAGMFLAGLILNFMTAMVIGLGLIGIGRFVPDYRDRARLVVSFAVAAAFFIHIGRPVYLHHDWSNAIYSFLVDGLALAVGGLIVAWFIPRHREEVSRSNAAASVDTRKPPLP